ncbi:large ribosomal subunit protein eL28-like [Panthera onca]|uniref:60S ribosomal protein L28-like n=1 Tax=Panthera tigris TaxID=9694 RepID=UPI000766218A|nr:60S ribosomal protein L28-like [Panthera tigris]
MQNSPSFLVKRNKQTYKHHTPKPEGSQPLPLKRADSQEDCGHGAMGPSRIKHVICKNNYCPDLRLAAIHRASTILHRQDPVMVKRQQLAPPRAP